MVRTSAAVQAADMLMGPVEKFSMAGVRPKAINPKSDTTRPAALGSSRATILLARGETGQFAAQNEACHDQAVVGQRRALDILDDLVCAAVDFPCIQQGLPQGLVDVGGLEDHIGHDIVELFSLMFAQGGALQLRR